MNIEEAIKKIKSNGLEAKIRHGNCLAVYSAIENIGEIETLKNFHLIIQSKEKWSVYDGGQIPKSEFNNLESAVKATIKYIKTIDREKI